MGVGNTQRPGTRWNASWRMNALCCQHRSGPDLNRLYQACGAQRYAIRLPGCYPSTPPLRCWPPLLSRGGQGSASQAISPRVAPWLHRPGRVFRLPVCWRCAVTPKGDSALPFPGCLVTCPSGPCATRSQGSHPIALVDSESTLPSHTAITASQSRITCGPFELSRRLMPFTAVHITTCLCPTL